MVLSKRLKSLASRQLNSPMDRKTFSIQTESVLGSSPTVKFARPTRMAKQKFFRNELTEFASTGDLRTEFSAFIGDEIYRLGSN